jgi:hypothetical protein
MSTKVTRRQVAIGIVSGTVALAQTPVPPVPQTPEEELKAVQLQIRQNTDALAKFALPQTAEPAFVFRA